MRTPSWAHPVQAHGDKEAEESSDIPAMCGKFLVLARTLKHLAYLAQAHKHPPGQPWHFELVRVFRAVQRRAAKIDQELTTLELVEGQHGWRRVVLAAKLDAQRIQLLHRTQYTTYKAEARKRLAETIEAPTAAPKVFRLLREDPQAPHICVNCRRLVS